MARKGFAIQLQTVPGRLLIGSHAVLAPAPLLKSTTRTPSRLCSAYIGSIANDCMLIRPQSISLTANVDYNSLPGLHAMFLTGDMANSFENLEVNITFIISVCFDG